MTLEEMILRAIPVNTKCAFDESYNKECRKWLKAKFEAYLEEQLSTQFNAKSITGEFSAGVSSNTG